MKNKTVLIVLIIILVAIGYFMFFSPSASQNGAITPSPVMMSSPTPSPVASSGTTPRVPATGVVHVNIKNFAFNDSSLTVKVGTTVTWTNNDKVAHTVTADNGTLINSGMLVPGASYSVKFTAAGPISYHCNFHTMMRGTIIVVK